MNVKSFKTLGSVVISCLLRGRYDTQHSGIQHDSKKMRHPKIDIQCLRHVIMLSVVILNVVAPLGGIEKYRFDGTDTLLGKKKVQSTVCVENRQPGISDTKLFFYVAVASFFRLV